MKKKVLFLCPGNACHSQMAEGLLKHFYSDDYEVFSAGLNPIEVNKNAVEVMKEVGIDISENTSKHLDNYLNQHFDIIITLCDVGLEPYKEFLASAKVFNWSLFEPSEMISAQGDLPKAFRELRDEMSKKIHEQFKK